MRPAAVRSSPAKEPTLGSALCAFFEDDDAATTGVDHAILSDKTISSSLASRIRTVELDSDLERIS
jgi:hypothetical protein